MKRQLIMLFPEVRSILRKKISDYIYKMGNADLFRIKKILIVDDNQIDLLLLKSILDRNGFQVDECDNGNDAIKKIKSYEYSLIFIDINMPDNSGTKVLYEIRENINKKIPVVAVHTDFQQSEVSRYKAMGFEDILFRPFDEIEIVCGVGNILTANEAESDVCAKRLYTVERHLNNMTSGNPAMLQDLKKHLKAELFFAIESLNKAIKEIDWTYAKSIMHREKVLLETIGVKEFDFMLQAVLIDGIVYADHEMIMIYEAIAQAFSEIFEWANC